MRNEQTAVLTSLRRVQEFLDTHADMLSAVNASSRKQLDDTVTRLETLSIAQKSGDRSSVGETSRQHALLNALRRNYMAPVAELAKLNLRGTPQFSALKMPPSNTALQGVVVAAYTMADGAAPHAQTFIDNALPPTFIDDLRKAAAAVESSMGGRNKQLNQRSTATALLAVEERRGRSLLRVLTALVNAAIGTDEGMIVAWDAVKLVRRKPGPAAGSGTPVTPITPVVTPVHPVTPTAPTLVTSSTPTPVSAAPANSVAA